MTLKYLIRPDNSQKVFLSENDIDVIEILKTYYDYIYESIESENFILKYDKCNLFKELIYDNKVVGFCSYDFTREFITVALNNIYVIPEFRGNKLFLNEFKKTMMEHNKPSIMEPTRLIVELLIKYGLACKINDNIVASAFEFIVPASHVLSNGKYCDDELSTHFYDLDICSCIHVLDIQKGHVAYSAALNYDIIHYDCLDKINNMDENYFKDIINLFSKNSAEIMNTVVDLEENLPIKNYTLEEIIGDDENFSQYIETLIDDSHVTYQKAIEIKQQIREEYEAGMILNESLLIRLNYLFEEKPKQTMSSHEETCSYCNMPVDNHDKFCHYCGINLNYNPDEMENNLFKSINFEKSDFKEDIRFIAFKFLTLIDQRIETEYAIYTIENTYNISWSDLNQFLKDNDYFKNNLITKKGYDFMFSHPLHYWQKYQMDEVNYTDFEKYFYENSDSNPTEICLNYLNQFRDNEHILEIISQIKKE